MMSRERLCKVNNSVIFSVKPIGPGSIWGISNQMVDALGITIDRRPKGRSRKMESQTIEKIGVSLFYKWNLRKKR